MVLVGIGLPLAIATDEAITLVVNGTMLVGLMTVDVGMMLVLSNVLATGTTVVDTETGIAVDIGMGVDDRIGAVVGSIAVVLTMPIGSVLAAFVGGNAVDETMTVEMGGDDDGTGEEAMSTAFVLDDEGGAMVKTVVGFGGNGFDDRMVVDSGTDVKGTVAADIPLDTAIKVLGLLVTGDVKSVDRATSVVNTSVPGLDSVESDPTEMRDEKKAIFDILRHDPPSVG